MSKRNKKMRMMCPMCGRVVTSGITRSVCPRGHYEVEHRRRHNEVLGGEEVVPVERFALGAFVVTIDHGRGMNGASVEARPAASEASDG